MTVMKIVGIVTSCLTCPNKRRFDTMGNTFWCRAKSQMIDAPVNTDLPDWCPLEDYKTNDNATKD